MNKRIFVITPLWIMWLIAVGSLVTPFIYYIITGRSLASEFYNYIVEVADE
jgi:hypothetical protein